MKKKRIYTIGHSTRLLEEFLGLLKAHNIEKVVDIRTIPRSRHNPQFNYETLPKALRNAGIGYKHMKALGGLRKAGRGSLNLGWENLSFRGFADYMQTKEFSAGLRQLMKEARKKNTAVMCAEALVWRCHRSLVADALTKQKWKVYHIQSRKTARPHKLTAFLRMRKGKIVYPELK